MRLLFTFAMATALVGCAANPGANKKAAAAPTPMTAANYAALAQVDDDRMKPAISVVSGGPKTSPVHPSVAINDLRLIADVDRRTGATNYYMRLMTLHSGDSWASFSSATYMGADGVARYASDFQRVSGNVRCYRANSCDYTEGAVFKVTESELQEIIAAGENGRRPSKWWPIRINGVLSLDFVMADAEIDGFLQAVRQQRSKVLASAAAR